MNISKIQKVRKVFQSGLSLRSSHTKAFKVATRQDLKEIRMLSIQYLLVTTGIIKPLDQIANTFFCLYACFLFACCPGVSNPSQILPRDDLNNFTQTLPGYYSNTLWSHNVCHSVCLVYSCSTHPRLILINFLPQSYLYSSFIWHWAINKLKHVAESDCRQEV